MRIRVKMGMRMREGGEEEDKRRGEGGGGKYRVRGTADVRRLYIYISHKLALKCYRRVSRTSETHRDTSR